MPMPRSIVIVKLSAIGDVLHGVPVAVALKRAFPGVAVGWVAEGRAADVLAGHPAVDRIFRVPRGWLKQPRAVWALRRDLIAFAPDAAIDLQGLLKSAVATWLSGAPIRIGHARPEAREYAWLASTHPVRATAAHVVDRNCQLLTVLGVRETRPQFAMPHWPASRAAVQEWLEPLRLPGPPVLINPGAGWLSKIWPEERFAAVAAGLHRRTGERAIIVWGGPSEQAAASRIAAAASGAALVAPATTLEELGELCRLSRLFISSDTGPLHLAAAVGTPCVGLMGPVPAERNGPYGAHHTVVEPPASLRPQWPDRKTDTRAMAGIGVDQVLTAAEALLTWARAAA